MTTVLNDAFDAVVMLTWSNWHIEPRSNRYHYATRFARHLRVYFVQQTESGSDEVLEEIIPDSNIRIVHAGGADANRKNKLKRFLEDRNVQRPLYWIYNPLFADFVETYPGVMNVYHGTEDYFAGHADFKLTDKSVRDSFSRLFERIDLVVAVTEGVAQSAREFGPFRGPVLVLKNGCDFDHWHSAVPSPMPATTSQRIAIYQGAVNFRLDYPLIEELAQKMPDWEFWFCGSHIHADHAAWGRICNMPNVRAFGMLHPDEVAKLQVEACVAIIPFRQISIMRISLPLKAYEYVASGLPVVTVPIDELENKPELFRLATTAGEFEIAIRALAPTRWNEEATAIRWMAAAAMSYDNRFEELLGNIEAHVDKGLYPMNTLRESMSPVQTRKQVLVAYSASGSHVQTTLDYLQSLSRYLDADVQFVHVTHDAVMDFDFGQFDVVFHSYCARWPFDGHVSEHYSQALARFQGLKILAVQDEYDRTNNLRTAISKHNFDVVLTCVPKDQIEKVYPKRDFPNVEFVQVLTGYVPENLSALSRYALPLSERPWAVGYRGRDIGGRFGRLALEKLEIGQRVRAACEARGLRVNIDWTEDSRIYGEAWLSFMGSCRSTLGTESGSNVFDDDGSIEARFNQITQQQGKRPSYEEFLPTVQKQDESIDMGQVSPKIFEAAALRTPLILLRGRYSDVIKPDDHYIPLEKDYSNLDAVLDRLNDLPALEAMANRTHEHLVASNSFSYNTFVKFLDELIDRKMGELKSSDRCVRRGTTPAAPDTPAEDQGILFERPTSNPNSFDWLMVKIARREANIYKRETTRLAAVISDQSKRMDQEFARLNSEIYRLGGKPLGRRRERVAAIKRRIISVPGVGPLALWVRDKLQFIRNS